MEFVEKIKLFMQRNKEEIMLIIGVFLISLLSFAIGFISGKEEVKKPVEFNYERTEQ